MKKVKLNKSERRFLDKGIFNKVLESKETSLDKLSKELGISTEAIKTIKRTDAFKLLKKKKE